MSSEVKKLDFSEKTKNIDFPTFCEVLNKEIGIEVDKQVSKQFYQENQQLTLRTAISKASASLKQQALDATLEEWRGVAFGMRDFTWKDQNPENMKQVWIPFLKEDGKLEELKCWGSHINSQKVPFGHLVELKGSWNEYTSPDTHETYKNWIPKQMKVLKELTRAERIALCEKNYYSLDKFTRGLVFSPVIGFGEIARVLGVTKWTNNAKDGSYDLLQRKRDGSDGFALSVLLKTQGTTSVTIDFEPQQLATFFFDVLDFDEVISAALQKNNPIREISNALLNRKIYYIGNFKQSKQGQTKTREDRIYIHIRGTSLIETQEYPKGYSPSSAPTPSSASPSAPPSTPPQSEETKNLAQVGYLQKVIPIMKAIGKLDTGTGVKPEDLQSELKLSNSDFDVIIQDAINTGDIYQPSPKRYRLLGTAADIVNYEKMVGESKALYPQQPKPEEEEIEEEQPINLVTAIIIKLLSDPKKWFDIADLKDLTKNQTELEQALENLKNDTTIAKAKNQLKYRLKVSVEEAKKMVGQPAKTQPPPKPKAESSQETIKKIKDAIETLGKSTTAEAILQSGLVDDSIPLEVIKKILQDMQKS